CLLDLGMRSRYRMLLSRNYLDWYTIALLVHHKNVTISKAILEAFFTRLKDFVLPMHFACVLPLVATVPDKPLRLLHAKRLTALLNRMRRTYLHRIQGEHVRSANKASSSSLVIDPVQLLYVPEFVLVYLIHLLSHHPDFDPALAKQELHTISYTYAEPTQLEKKRRSNEQEGSVVEYFGAIIDFFLEALFQKQSTANVPLVIALLDRIEQSTDDLSIFSKNHHYLVLIARLRLRNRSRVSLFVFSIHTNNKMINNNNNNNNNNLSNRNGTFILEK
ncbi:S-adenosylmethionine decarboxylase-ornithine decarboxylase, partial [Reticulomyxa filosa]